MADTTHTPGPWIVRTFPTGRAAAAVLWVTDATPDQGDRFVGQAICSVTGTNPAAAANAHLVAAAPELLAALRSVVATFADHPDRDEVSMALARAAIARATGQPTD